MKIVFISVSKANTFEGFKGTIEFQCGKIDNWISYDKNGNDIAFDYWYSDSVLKRIKDSIRKEIRSFKTAILY